MAKEKEKKQPFGKPVTEAEQAAALSGAASISNKIIVTTTPGGARISFLENLAGVESPAFRSAVFLHYSDLRELHQLLGQVLDQTQLVEITPEQMKELQEEKPAQSEEVDG